MEHLLVISDAVLLGILVLAGTLLNLIFQVIMVYVQAKVDKKVVAVGEKVETVHKQINSRMDEYLKAVAEKSHAEGVKQEKETAAK